MFSTLVSSILLKLVPRVGVVTLDLSFDIREQSLISLSLMLSLITCTCFTFSCTTECFKVHGFISKPIPRIFYFLDVFSD